MNRCQRIATLLSTFVLIAGTARGQCLRTEEQELEGWARTAYFGHAVDLDGDVTVVTVEREWRAARVWLGVCLKREPER